MMLEQERPRSQQLELQRASTLVECQTVIKSFDLDDLGQGQPNGGSKQHAKNRLDVLERLKSKAKPLPPDLANDWNWFMKHWDRARVSHLPPHQKPAWAKQFRDLVLDLLERIRDDGDALIPWMKSERRKYLAAPALQI